MINCFYLTDLKFPLEEIIPERIQKVILFMLVNQSL